MIEIGSGLVDSKGNQLRAKGVFFVGKRGEKPEIVSNRVVLEGLNYMLASSLGTDSKIPSFRIALFSGDVVVSSSWTAATFAAQAVEFTQYEGAERPLWQRGTVAAGAVNSFSQKAEFISSINGAQIRGAALISSAGKGATSGKLIAAARFPSTKNLDEGEILDVGYGIELVPVGQ